MVRISLGYQMSSLRGMKGKRRDYRGSIKTDQLGLCGITYTVKQRELSQGEQSDKLRKRQVWDSMTDKQRQYAPRFEIRNGLKTPFNQSVPVYKDKNARLPAENHPWRGTKGETPTFGMPEVRVKNMLEAL